MPSEFEREVVGWLERIATALERLSELAPRPDVPTCFCGHSHRAHDYETLSVLTGGRCNAPDCECKAFALANPR